MWLPNIGVGVDYYRHDGQIQDVVGNVFTTSRSLLLVGGGPTAVLPIKVRPFVPTVALRGVGSQVPGPAGGVFGGGRNGDLSNFGGRFSFDLQAVWEVQNLGLGNRAAVRERQAEQRASLLQLLRT